MVFEFYHDPVNSLGVNLSYDRDKNNNLNFFVKIYKMDTKLNMWQTRDLTLFGRTMLVKTLGISKLVYAASMLCVPEMVIKTVQAKILKFLWKNKKDKVKRMISFISISLPRWTEFSKLSHSDKIIALELARQALKLYK